MSGGNHTRTGTLFAATVMFGYMIYVGLRFRAGHDMPDGFRLGHKWGPDFINGLADSYGGDSVGLVLMGVGIVGAATLAIWVWRNPID